MTGHYYYYYYYLLINYNLKYIYNINKLEIANY